MILDGKTISHEIVSQLKERVVRLHAQLKILVILVGEGPASLSFINQKKKFADKIGVEFKLVHLPIETTEQEIINHIKLANSDIEVSGIVVQLPLPKNINRANVLNSIDVIKDPDVLSSEAYAGYIAGKSAIFPPVVGAVAVLLDKTGVNMSDSDIAVVGYGRLVGEPVGAWLKSKGLEYVVATEETTNLKAVLSNADVIITGVGKPHLITKDMIKAGAILLDAGTSDLPRDPSALSTTPSKISGDIDPACANKASYMSPVPGGIGPVAVAILFANLLTLSLSRRSAK